MEDLLARSKSAVVDEWFDRTIQAYPSQTSMFLRSGKDPFRNPVGHTLREGLAALFDELIGEMDRSRVTAALDSIVRLRAVQDFSPSQALAFPFQLKSILRERAQGEELARLESRIDELALAAFDLYAACREQLHEIKANQARRSTFVPERIQLRRGTTQ